MKTLTKWFIINATIATSAFFAAYKGLFTVIISSDVSYISVVSMILFVLISGFVGKLAFLVDSYTLPKEELVKQLDIGWFISGHFLNLGLLGTVIGFCYMIGATLDGSKDVGAIISDLKTGAGTALYTTLVGLVCSMLLQGQLYLIQYKIK